MRIAVLSPSSRAAAIFPEPYELGIERLRDLGHEPIEYPTTRAPVASPEDRARDVNEAFADPQIDALVATIGGDDELTVLPYLDLDVLRANPKPFYGYSDNTNLHVVLWNLGIPSYHGGSVLVQLGRPGAMHPLTRESLERALQRSGPWELPQPDAYTDEEQTDWCAFDPSAEPVLEPAAPWSWHGRQEVVTGRTWGGCLEIVDLQLRASRWLRPNDAYAGCVLLLETSEELPDDLEVYRMLMCMGERGLLQQFAAVLWGRPKAWSFEHPHDAEQKRAYVEAQRQAARRALAEYSPDVPFVFGVDFGHTDPQLVLPYGSDVTVDMIARRIVVTY